MIALAVYVAGLASTAYGVGAVPAGHDQALEHGGPMRTLTPQHKAAMQAGRRRAKDLRTQHAEARVRAFRAWLKRGSPLREIPEIPSDNDFALVEGGN